MFESCIASIPRIGPSWLESIVYRGIHSLRDNTARALSWCGGIECGTIRASPRSSSSWQIVWLKKQQKYVRIVVSMSGDSRKHKVSPSTTLMMHWPSQSKRRSTKFNNAPLGKFHSKNDCVPVGWEVHCRRRWSHPQRALGRIPSCRLFCSLPLFFCCFLVRNALNFFRWSCFWLCNGLGVECVRVSLVCFYNRTGTAKVDKIHCFITWKERCLEDAEAKCQPTRRSALGEKKTVRKPTYDPYVNYQRFESRLWLVAQWGCTHPFSLSLASFFSRRSSCFRDRMN